MSGADPAMISPTRCLPGKRRKMPTMALAELPKGNLTAECEYRESWETRASFHWCRGSQPVRAGPSVGLERRLTML